MSTPLQILMTGLIDYEGLLPPAGLDMLSAVRNYAEWRRGPYGHWLGRFVVPARRLREFEDAVDRLKPELDNPWDGLRMSVLLEEEDLSNDLEDIRAINRRHKLETWGGPDLIDSVEIQVGTAEEIRRVVETVPGALMPYLEIPVQDDPTNLVNAIGQTGGRAKVRTDGVPAQMIPYTLARFLAACARAKVAFKVTAGLAHAVPRERWMAGGPDSSSSIMYGFFNLFLAAAFAREGLDTAAVAKMIGEKSPEAFLFDDYGASWGASKLNGLQLRSARQRFAIAFGSCAFEEPIEDLQRTGLLFSPAL